VRRKRRASTIRRPVPKAFRPSAPAEAGSQKYHAGDQENHADPNGGYLEAARSWHSSEG
jgi:hypothetical protein